MNPHYRYRVVNGAACYPEKTTLVAAKKALTYHKTVNGPLATADFEIERIVVFANNSRQYHRRRRLPNGVVSWTLFDGNCQTPTDCTKEHEHKSPPVLRRKQQA